ncbi:MAG: TrkH family potassium uptake protein [Sulfolobales archaeon]
MSTAVSSRLMKFLSVLVDFHHILSSLIRILFILGFLFLLPAVVGIIYGEVFEVRVMMLLSILLLVPTYILSHYLGPPKQINLSSALVIAGISWLIVPFFGALPYMLICGVSLVDAYFESMSGFTTTGMTVLTNLESLPRTLLFWRSLTQWVGGMGIILLFMIVAGPLSGIDLFRLYVAEARELKVRASTWITIRDLWIIYLIYTMLCMLMLWASGLNLFDALNHSFTAIATGGFSTRDSSIAAFNNPYVELVLTVFEFLGATSFIAHYALFKYGIKAFFKYYEVRYYLSLISISSAIITADLALNKGVNFPDAMRNAIFQVVSIITTTGYLTSDINLWPPLSKYLLLLLMVVGGNLCSTGGAIKVGRIVATIKVISNQLQHLYLPPATVRPIKINSHILENEVIIKIFTFLSLYLTLICLGTLTFTSLGYEPFAALSLIVSAQGNVGPAYASIVELGVLPKLILILYMWLGRLELLPALAIFIPPMWVHARRRTS